MNRTFGYLLTIVILGLLVIGWVGNLRPEGAEVRMTGSDVIVIQRPDVFGKLERPAVAFMHEKHVAALGKEQCTACHKDNGGKLAIEFVRTDDGTRGEVMDAYHGRCTACHTERATKGEKAGPQDCGGCHVLGVVWVSSHRPAGLDLALHKQHVDAFGGKEKCDDCHKAKDPKAPRLIYEMQADLKGLPLMQAAHTACVGCHYTRTKSGAKAGPVNCSGCHEKHAMPDSVVKPVGLPEGYRLLRDQKDTSILYVGEAIARLPEVTFPHKTHEGVASSCRTCHHNSLQACRTCHTLEGTEKGDGVKLLTAYHAPFSMRSCVGCHRAETTAKACTGCHAKDPVDHSPSDRSCLTCHHQGDRPVPRPDIPDYPSDPIPIKNTYSDEFDDRFGPSSFNHDKHIKRLEKLIQDDDSRLLADRFHAGKQFLCEACHHHGPPREEGTKPPRCTFCHGERRDPGELALPGTPGAYHQLCVGCHERMNVEKEGKPLDCTGCHPSREEKR